ncbi:MAG: sugar phosphate isomerase/epimerase [Bryobacteraceae bacterium]|nr:sugar phosphate isomerase/epimerase [Bryobacteraceae bacterium]
MAVAAAALSAGSAQAARLPLRKGVLLGMLPRDKSMLERFELAKECGFHSIEAHTMTDPKEAEAAKAASEKTGLPIHSVMNSDHWRFPLSSANPADVEKSLEGMRTSLRNAKLWGADTVLLVPGVVNPEVGYQQAWDRSVAAIRKLLPLAEELKVVIGIENVWNKFLLSPIEFAHYVDQFKSPYVKAYFDVGNIWLYGFSHDWIRTLGSRIVKIHLKDFSFRQDPTIKKRVADFTPLRDGDLDWKAIHKALMDIGYKGDATVELPGGGAEHLKEISRRVDLILEGAD